MICFFDDSGVDFGREEDATTPLSLVLGIGARYGPGGTDGAKVKRSCGDLRPNGLDTLNDSQLDQLVLIL